MRTITIALVALVLGGGLASEACGLGAYAAYWHGDDTDSGAGFGVKRNIVPLPIQIVGFDVRASWLKFTEGGRSLNVVPLEATGTVGFGLFYGGLGVGYYILDDADNLVEVTSR